MFLLENLKYNKLYKKQFMLPFIKEDKRRGSAILLLTPNYQSSLALMNNKFCLNKANSFVSYYLERDIMYTINHESRYLETDHYDFIEENGVLLEDPSSVFTETTDVQILGDLNEEEITDEYYRCGDTVIFFNELYDILNEETIGSTNMKYKRLLYNDRLRNNKDIITIYNKVKADNPWIKRTYLNYNKYKRLNIFVDLYYYNQAYLNNNTFTIKKSVDMYYEFLRRFIMDKRITNAGYTKKTIFVPVLGWGKEPNTMLYDYRKNLNPISVLFKRIRFNQIELKNSFKDTDFVFFGNNGYFKFNAEKMDRQSYMRFQKFIKVLEFNETIDDTDEEDNSSDAIAANIIAKIETNKGIIIHNLTGNAADAKTIKDADKALLVKKINDASRFAKTEEDALNKLDQDRDVKRILSSLEDDADEGINLSSARVSRINQNRDTFMQKQIDGKSVSQMINESNKPKELNETSIPIETINTEWHHMKTMNFEKEYDLEADIIKCLNSLSDKNKSFPVSILDISTEDTSTSEDSIYTYTVKCEGYDGKRFSLKFDIPKFRDHRFMRLRGNEKIFSIEMPLIPISKTSDSRTQIVSFYNKLFVDRYNTSAGKSNPYSDRLLKALKKYNGSNIKTVIGDNSRICTKYNLPIDYIDLASMYSKIIYNTSDGNVITVYFNQDEIRKIPGVNSKNGLPIALDSKGRCLYYRPENNSTIAQFIANTIDDENFRKIYQNQTELKRATYSRVWILNTYIPTIVILAHDLGLIPAMDLAGVKYDISSKRTVEFDWDYIKLKDGYINFYNTYDSMMIMNGLKDCNLDDVSIQDLNKKSTWVAQLDNFGGRGKSDGLDNFKDLMYDPITIEVSRDYKLPTNYHEALIYASNLLVDNKHVKHADLSSNRYRTNEVVAAHFYWVLSSSYKEYANSNKRGRHVPMTMKQSAVVDAILAQNTTSDLSIFQPLLEIETRSMISTKGKSGLNSDRAYTLDKRSYTDSMSNIIAQSTNFASNVGLNRQTTLDANVIGGRGYFKQSSIEKDGNVTKSLCMTEALSPFVTSSNDSFRNDMSFVQNSKHATPIEKSMPELITTGAQEALPYMVSDMFSFKAKKNGKITAITPDYMLIEYADKTKDYVNMAEQTMKNSDGGFYITLQLTTDKKVGQSVKQGEIVAWDKKSFSKHIGKGNQLAYNNGALAKVAVLSTEDSFEDSGVCSEWLSKIMASNIVVMKSIVLPASTNVLSIVKKGQKVKEGDPILIFQNAFDENDANVLLKNLSIDDGDITTIGRNIVKSKVTGDIADIKVYRTCEIKDMSDSLQKIFKGKESQIKKLKSIAIDSETEVYFDSTSKLSPTGKLKNAENSVLIEIYMRYYDIMAPGDKLVQETANKNVLMALYPDDESPYTDFRRNEVIDAIGGASAIDGRIITSPFKSGALNKCLIELQRKCCEIYGEEWLTIHEMYDYFYKK